MPQAGPDNLQQCRRLSDVLQHTGRLPESAVSHILALLLSHIADTPSGCICASSVWLVEGVATVQAVSLAEPKNASTQEAGSAVVPKCSAAKVPGDLAYSPERLRAGSGSVGSAADDVWAVGALAVECALASQPADCATALTRLRDSKDFTPAFLDVVAACFTAVAERPTIATLRKHDFFAQHAGSVVWLRKDGRVQLQLSKEIVEAGTRYLYSELRAGDNAAVGSFLTEQSVVVVGDTVTSGAVAELTIAVNQQPLRGCIANTIVAEPVCHKSIVADGAQASWLATVSGAALDGSLFSHRLTLGIADTSADEMVVERWEIPLPAPSGTLSALHNNSPAAADTVAIAAQTGHRVQTPMTAWRGRESPPLFPSPPRLIRLGSFILASIYCI